MHIICLTPIEEGIYNDVASGNITSPPEGWAYIPEDFPKPFTFPRLGSLEAEEINGVMTVTKMTEGTVPEPIPEPVSAEEQLRADIDYLAIMTGVEL